MKNIILASLILLTGCKYFKTKSWVEVTAEDNNCWIMVDKGDIVDVKLRFYEHLPYRWVPETKVNVSPEYQITKNKNWIPGDYSYVSFRYEIKNGAKVLCFNLKDTDQKLTFYIGMRRIGMGVDY